VGSLSARLLEQRSTKDHRKGKGPEVGERGRKGRDIERRQGARPQERTEDHDRKEAKHHLTPISAHIVQTDVAKTNTRR
jgi:hypothetical protein